MIALIVYDSVFGNTAKVAEAIADELAGTFEVRLRPVAEAGADELSAVALLVVGSPTRGFRPTPAMQEFLGRQSRTVLGGLRAAAFDTRIDLDSIHPAPLRWVVDVGGYAADVLRHTLAESGCIMAAEPAGFLVEGTEGPLKDGELERARAWAQTLGATIVAD